ncbi:MAG: S8 family serine peptidase [Alistipes sp.]|nr:S8 family serine peptidase [Alistipes sp.]
MNKVKITLFALAAIFAVSCVQDPVMEESVATDAKLSAAKKIINTSDYAQEGKLILFVDDATADIWANAEVATRSGIVECDALAAEIGAKSIEPVFDMTINREEKMAYSLHRWFVVTFDAETDLNAAAEKFAGIAGVKRVQFATKLARPAVKVHPVEEVMATRAESEMPFNDPMLDLQWHYNNEGLKSIYKYAKEGEDINAFAAWKYTTGNPEVIVAVVDEGVKYTHPDLKDNMWVNTGEIAGNGKDDDGNGVVDDVHGYNCSKNNGNITWDQGKFVMVDGVETWVGDSGHGTHVAGTVAAVNNNGTGVGGVAGGDGSGNGVRIMSIQVFDGTSDTSLEQNARGITYAADNGASILQNSWGYPSIPGITMSDALYENKYGVELDALRYFAGKSNCPAMTGNVIIFAAGNDANPSADYPGAYNQFLCVTAFGPDGLPTSYTNYDLGCNVSAPGGDFAYEGYDYKYDGCVLSTLPKETIDSQTKQPYGTDYGYMQGTSMACPHVSGVAALVLSYAMDNGIQLTSTELYEILTSSVRNIDNQLTGTKPLYPGYESYGSMNLTTYKGKMGTGKLDALMAIMNARGAVCAPATVGKELELKIQSFLGNGDISVKAFNEYQISNETKERLGIEKVEFFSTSIYLTCKKPGIGVITVKYIAGGSSVGGGNSIGGKLMEKDIVIVAREANDNGGWL